MNKNEKYEILSEYIKDRTQVYKFYRDMFYALPTEDIISNIKKFNGDLEDDLQSFERTLITLSNKLSQEKKENLLSELRAEFTYLFIGPKSPPASLFESVYLSPRKQLFDKVTSEVRAEYFKNGLKVEKKGSIPDDHIAYELEFLYFLSDKAYVTITKNKTIKELKQTLITSSEFMQNHLLKWVEEFSIRVNKSANFDFYKLISKSMVEFLNQDILIINELIQSL